MSELKKPIASEPLSSGDEESLPPVVVAEPVDLAVGDRFEKRGRRVIAWKVDAIANPPHEGKIITFSEIDGTARIQVPLADIIEMGFNRIEGLLGLPATQPAY
jgi:hypothetical protein